MAGEPPLSGPVLDPALASTPSATPSAAEAGPVAKRRGRPRSHDCHQAILTATVELLESGRYADLTMEGVASRAQVAKQTLYKWWPSKAKLAMEAYASRMFVGIPAPDTGSVEQDLRQFLYDGCKVLSRGNAGATYAGLIAAAQCDPELGVEFRETFIASRRKVATGMLQKGVERGELRDDIDIPIALDLLFGAIWYRLLVRTAPLNRAFADSLVAHALPALRKAPESHGALDANASQGARAPKGRRSSRQVQE